MGYRLETVEYLFRTSFEDFFQECTEIKENNKLLKKEGHRWIEDTQNQIVVSTSLFNRTAFTGTKG